jgi:hypothetical protein
MLPFDFTQEGLPDDHVVEKEQSANQFVASLDRRFPRLTAQMEMHDNTHDLRALHWQLA